MKTLVDKVKQALHDIPDVEFSTVVDQRAKTVVKANSSSPAKARARLCLPEFSAALGVPVVPLRKTIENGFSVLVQDPEYGKPLYIRIRKGGTFAGGVKNEAGLVSILQDAIDAGIGSVRFKGANGTDITVKNMVAVRRVGDDAGSRTGSRADIEITDAKGVPRRFSIKKENANGVAGLIRYFTKRRLAVQRKLRAFLAENPGAGIHPRGYVAIPIMNERLFEYCWFGNDIDGNGGVLIGDFDDSSFSVCPNGNTVVIKCAYVFSPNDDIGDLMEDFATGIDLLMKVNLRTMHLDIIGAKLKKFGFRYELPGFELDEVTSESSEFEAFD